MSTYNRCPNCGLRVDAAHSSNFLVIYKCAECNAMYCRECADSCPSCRSNRRLEVEKLYA